MKSGNGQKAERDGAASLSPAPSRSAFLIIGSGDLLSLRRRRGSSDCPVRMEEPPLESITDIERT